MIVTRNWLSEWIDIADITTEELVKALNSLGLEVAEVRKIEVPANVVVGKVVSCQKHPNADKLNLCEVDVGDEKLQIVCGAKNVVDAEYVAVAKVGAKLPGLTIKPAKLRGVESFGMICAADEIGLPKLENGIMKLDSSIGKLELGKELREYDAFNDELIDIELTANRGDCLSILGIARELTVAFDRPLKEVRGIEEEGVKVGIGRILQFDPDKNVEANLIYKAFEKENFANPLLVRLRVGLAGENFANEAETLAFYITHSTGVLMRIYGYRFFEQDGAKISIKHDLYDEVYGKERASVVGVVQFDVSKPQPDERIFVLEASFVEPESISKKMYEKPLESDWAYYRASRGSDPRVQLGIDFAKYLLHGLYGAKIYSGKHEHTQDFQQEAIKVDFAELNALIGYVIDKNEIVEILKKLGFTILNINEDSFSVTAPSYRHDIFNIQDVAEEIVRVFGIDNIAAKPLVFAEANRINDAYNDFQKAKQLRQRAVACGYFESVSYVFTQREWLERLQLPVVDKKLDLINPITNELDTLRTSLVPNLLQQTINNIKNGKRSVKLFEIGTIFDQERNEKQSMVLIYSGWAKQDSILNHGKPQEVHFAQMATDLGEIFGAVEFVNTEATNALMHPYQSAFIIQRGQTIGKVYKLHTKLQEELELPATYIAEIEYDKVDVSYPKAKGYSIYQRAMRDLSILVDKNLSYQKIKEALQDLPDVIKEFYVVDIYEDEKLGEQKSVTLRFAVQSDTKTLSEEEIAQVMEQILARLQEKVGAKLR